MWQTRNSKIRFLKLATSLWHIYGKKRFPVGIYNKLKLNDNEPSTIRMKINDIQSGYLYHNQSKQHLKRLKITLGRVLLNRAS